MQTTSIKKSSKKSMINTFKIRKHRGNVKKKKRKLQKLAKAYVQHVSIFRRYLLHLKLKLAPYIINESYPFIILRFTTLVVMKRFAMSGVKMTLRKDQTRLQVVCLIFWKKVEEGITNFYFWSDNCAGENRNKNVFSMLVYASAKLNIDIKYSFLEVGHTQNEGDSVHATIERYSRGRKIFTQNEWSSIITNAEKTSPTYEVRTVTLK